MDFTLTFDYSGYDTLAGHAHESLSDRLSQMNTEHNDRAQTHIQQVSKIRYVDCEKKWRPYPSCYLHLYYQSWVFSSGKIKLGRLVVISPGDSNMIVCMHFPRTKNRVW